MGVSRLERFYDRSPIWFQNTMVTTQGVLFRLRRTRDRDIRRSLAFLLESQWWTAEEFADYQLAQLQALLDVAFTRVPHYRDWAAREKCSAQDFRAVSDIRRLPILTKQELRGNEHRFLSDGLDLSRCYRYSTSGTTGTPLTLYEPRESLSRRVAYVARLRTEAGLSDALHPRRAMATGRKIVPTAQLTGKHVYWRRNLADNAMLMSAGNVSPETAPHYTRALRSFGTELIDGFPSTIKSLARCNGGTVSIPTLRAIITTAETVTVEDRAEIENAYSVKLFNQYAASEPSAFWWDCRSGNMHMSPEYGVSELIDAAGNEVDEGEEGRVILSSFLNHGMIMLRYAVGDYAVRGPAAGCACGRAMPQVSAITGRVEQDLYLPGRGWMRRLDTALKGLTSIIEAQIVHEQLDRLRVLIVRAPGYSPAQERSLRDNLIRIIGTGIGVDISYVDNIPRGPNGKFSAVITRIKEQYPKGRDTA